MKTMVRFRAGDSVFNVPAAEVLAVRSAREVKTLPGPKDGVAGLLERDGLALTVVSPLVAHGEHVLVLGAPEGALGLLVDEVLGLVEVNESDVSPPPAGQARPLIEGVLMREGRLEFVLAVSAVRQGLSDLGDQPMPAITQDGGLLADELPLRLLLVEDNHVVQKVMK